MSINFNLINFLVKNREKGNIVWIFNIGAERYWNNEDFTIKDVNENQIVNHIEEMNLLLTRKQDLFILRDKPNEKYLIQMQQWKFEIPKIICPKHSEDDDRGISELVLEDKELLSLIKKYVQEHEVVYLVPYAVTKLEEQISKVCNLKLLFSSSEIYKKINSKVYSRGLAEKLGFKVTDGIVCNSIKEVENNAKLMLTKYEKIIIKEPCSSSGKGLFVIKDNEKLKTVLLILKKFSKQNIKPEWIVEQWCEKKKDINYQIYIDSDGNINVFSIKEQIVDGTIYIGSVMPPRISDKVKQEYINYGNIVGRELYKNGFRGVVGVDSIIIDSESIIPIIEINARFTLSTYISFLTHKFPNCIMRSFYKKIRLKDGANYATIVNMLISNNLLFDDFNKKGVLCYVSETLNPKKDNCNGRFFAIIIGQNEDEIVRIHKKVVNILNEVRR